MSNACQHKITENGVLESWEGKARQIVIPEGVVEIGKGVFCGYNKLTKVDISDGVKIIGEGAFSECVKLQQVTLPDSLETIGSGAFFFTDLRRITIPKGVTKIGSYAFAMTYLISVVIPESVRSIGDSAFNFEGDELIYKGPLSDVTILGSEVTVGKKAFPEGFGVRIYAPNAPLSQFAAAYKRQIIFTYLTGEKEYRPERVEEYNKYIDKTDDFIGLLIKNRQTAALCKLLQIKSKINPEKLDAFLAQAERNSEMKAALLAYQEKMVSPQMKEKAAQRKIDIASGVKTRTVAEWKKLFSFEKRDDGLVITSYKGEAEVVEVPGMIGKDKVIAIGEEAFYPFALRIRNVDARRKIRQIILPDSITSIEKAAFKSCSGLERIELPNSITSIGDYAFSSCRRLESVVLPDSVASIGRRAFEDCWSLVHVVISAGAASIDGCFCECVNLSKVVFRSGMTKISWDFYKCPNVKIHASADSNARNYAEKCNIPFVAE